ncbi:MAG: sigma-70 family RNA polymerase sigma factor [Bryobacteraceae bacterium]
MTLSLLAADCIFNMGGPVQLGSGPPVDKQREIELAKGLLSGDADAFERFVEHFRTRLFQYSWLVCHQREDAEEVAQEALLKVFESADQLREPEHVRAWVFRIARNACLMKRRRSVFAPEEELSLDQFFPATDQGGEHRHMEIADWSQAPERDLLRRELRETVGEAISQLPETYRSVVLLRDVEELSTEETAQILGLGTDVVKTRLHRGRLAIRQKLDDYMRTYGTQPREL